MILGGDETGLKVSNQPNGGGVTIRKTEELSGPRARFPFRNFVAVLETGIQNI